MIELPEARTIAKDLRREILGKKVVEVGRMNVDHKFTFYQGNPEEYAKKLCGKVVTDIVNRNYYVEIVLEEQKLILRDGAQIRYYPKESPRSKKSALFVVFEDGSYLDVTTLMYCVLGVMTPQELKQDPYYQLELCRPGAMEEDFTWDYFLSLIDSKTEELSLKAFLATKQRIPGVGNGVLQDILFMARLHPKRKIRTLQFMEKRNLYEAIRTTLKQMIEQNGRDTEKTIYGEFGQYQTKMSHKNYRHGCPICHREIVKENYLGGVIYYCPHCQEEEPIDA